MLHIDDTLDNLTNKVLNPNTKTVYFVDYFTAPISEVKALDNFEHQDPSFISFKKDNVITIYGKEETDNLHGLWYGEVSIFLCFINLILFVNLTCRSCQVKFSAYVLVLLKPLDTFGTEFVFKYTDLQITYRVYRR